jgi:hypothetical protein
MPSNLSSYQLKKNSRIIGIAANTNGAETWTAEVRRNGGLTPIATLSLTGVAKRSRCDYAVDVDQDDIIQGYCNGASINHPHMTVYLEERE